MAQLLLNNSKRLVPTRHHRSITSCPDTYNTHTGNPLSILKVIAADGGSYTHDLCLPDPSPIFGQPVVQISPCPPFDNLPPSDKRASPLPPTS
ncbi:hypothetical protein AUEXF2481DRAFT_35087 [Aureobasidium subglaciale EXF-2481]|uniref:Uncharacterized protein n=1 Tax=Aureobasidium subglaciale (strain EXF-2481) TaxID=1043005 RepID=A0A074Z3F7_AURSE|nr:uncharacterized protein AUEXF2481DRAFT_35087 [Aureobasidium subglaciale EXF-2481]KER00838.1 hypothetical protein AUEXF2481DRAFT_35087 [Aureobasidium subglaciale EXF-2481]